MFSFHSLLFAQTHSLTLVIEGVQEVKGVMQIGLFNNSDDFLETGSEFRVASVTVDSTAVVFVFDSLPPTNYAISLYHDLDSSGEINKNFIGIPVEPWGISNDAWRLLSAPRWKEAAFKMNADTSIIIHLRD
jgi:uncharacterized protein (DUF2141 family)